MKSISLDIDRLGGSAVNGIFHFEIYNEKAERVFEYNIPVEQVTDSSFHKIKVEKFMKLNQVYSWETWVDGTSMGEAIPSIWCTLPDVVTPPDNISLYYGETEVGGSAVIGYEYGAKQGKIAMLTYYSFIILAGIILIEMFPPKKKSDDSI